MDSMALSPRTQDREIFQRAIQVQIHNTRVSYGRFKICLFLALTGCVVGAVTVVLVPSLTRIYTCYLCCASLAAMIVPPLLGIEHPSLVIGKMEEGLKYVHLRQDPERGHVVESIRAERMHVK